MTEVFYHGVGLNEAGHYLFEKGMRSVRGSLIPRDFPCPAGYLDSGFLTPGTSEVEGKAALWHVEGWTILAFWDRSGDSRGKSNSAFVIRGRHNLEDAIEHSRASFPEVWGRMTFEVRE